MSQLRNQLKDITFDDLTAAQIQLVGGRVYADSASRENVNDLVNVQKAWQAVHTPTVGQFIPQTGVWVTNEVSTGEEILIQATGNEVIDASYVGMYNGTAGTLTFSAWLEGANPLERMFFCVDENVQAGQYLNLLQVLRQNFPIRIDSGATLNVSASGASLLFSAYTYKVVQ